jgi:hypothetical protein
VCCWAGGGATACATVAAAPKTATANVCVKWGKWGNMGFIEWHGHQKVANVLVLPKKNTSNPS